MNSKHVLDLLMLKEPSEIKDIRASGCGGFLTDLLMQHQFAHMVVANILWHSRILGRCAKRSCSDSPRRCSYLQRHSRDALCACRRGVTRAVPQGLKGMRVERDQLGPVLVGSFRSGKQGDGRFLRDPFGASLSIVVRG